MKKKNYLFFKTFLAMAIIIGLSLNANILKAEELIVGQGNTQTYNYSFPFYTGWGCGTGEYLLTAAEIAAVGGDAGVITRIGMQFKQVNSTTYNWGNFKISMRNYDQATLPAGTRTSYLPDYTTVYERTNWTAASTGQSTFAVDDWLMFQLDTPFEYSGGALVIQICYWNGGSSNSALGAFRATTCTYGTLSYFRYIDNQPSTPCIWGYGPLGYNFRPDFKIDLEMGPMIKGVYPGDTIFVASLAGGDIVIPSLKIDRKANHPLAEVQYTITTDTSSPSATVWRAYEPTRLPGDASYYWVKVPANLITSGLPPNAIPFTFNFRRADGSRADITSEPAKLSFKSNEVKGGRYFVNAKLRYYKNPTTLKTVTAKSQFEVLYDYDMTIVSVTEPVSYKAKKAMYPLSRQPLKFATKFRNVGKNDLKDFKVTYTVIEKDSTTGAVKRTLDTFVDTIKLVNPLVKNTDYIHEITKFIPANYSITPGLYYFNVTVELLGVVEPYTIDNKQDIDFYLDYPYDGKMVEIMLPATDTTKPYYAAHYANQPLYPKVKVVNNAILDATATPVNVIITKQGTTKLDTVYNYSGVVSFLANNTVPLADRIADYEMTIPFIPSSEGDYQVIATIDKTDDFNPTDNTLTKAFRVLPSITGTCTVGANSKFATISQAIDALYTCGVKDTVTFVLTDSVYEVGNLDSEYALDFSSSISGFDINKNLIRFVPSDLLAKSKASIVIKFRSSTGIGLKISSAISSEFPNAPVNLLVKSTSKEVGKRQKDFYNFNVKVEFDGGKYKSINFQLADDVTGPNRIPVMLGEGARNITFRNCIFTGTSLPNPTIPTLFYDIGFNKFIFNPFTSVSAAMLIRNVPPVDANGQNSKALDTIVTTNIVLDNNIFEKGSYGIISIGIGPLYNVNKGYFISYYNKNNIISRNNFTAMDVAGIFLGYEEGTSILNNNIYLVGVNSKINADHAGIILGGLGVTATPTVKGITGYNNINITIDGNEISKINSHGDVYGIKVEQELNNFVYNHLTGEKFLPNKNDSIKIFNNVIWGLTTDSKSLSNSRYGIRLFASKLDSPLNKFESFTLRRDTNLTLHHCKIVNNSIVIEDDKKLNDDNAYIGGIVAQDVKHIDIYNNAISILDTANSSDVVAALVLQSERPVASNGIEIDNNVYYAPNNTLVRFIEMSSKNASILNSGSRKQFLGLEQWKYYTNTDELTTLNNFYSNLYLTKTNPQSLRIKSPAPIGSYLNNRGKRLEYVSHDVLGNQRGLLNQDYDIGAWEFEGKVYDNDLGVYGFVTPVSTRDYDDALFGEAEYIMTTNPVDVKVNIRNNGSLKIANRPVTLNVYILNDTTKAATLLKSYVKDFTAASMATEMLNFEIPKLPALDFPKSYKELGIKAPSRFAYMDKNVSPIYRFEVLLPDDEDNSNNKNLIAKDVRYYIKKSNVSTMISVDNTTLLPASFTGTDYIKYISDSITVDVDNQPVMVNKIAGYLNFRALIGGFNTLGFNNSSDTNSKYYDMFDRSQWEANSVNYTPYRYLLWADALNDTLTLTQEKDINKFVNSATSTVKKHIVVSSEEIARNSEARYSGKNEVSFIKSLFGTTSKGNGIYSITEEKDGSQTALITGNALMPGINAALANTSLTALTPAKDVIYAPALFENYGNNTRSILQAFYYTKKVNVSKTDKTFGIISYSPLDNLIYLGVDWRNYTDPSVIISAISNYINGFTEDVQEINLAIGILNFDAFVANNKVLISWETGSEINRDKFIVEKVNKQQGTKFIPIYEVASKGSKLISNSYSTIDEDVYAGNTYTYRLKAVDVNGTFSYSDEKIVSIDANSNFVALDKPTPNPAKDNLAVTFSLSSETNVRLSIFDMTGKEIYVLSEAIYSGKVHNLSFNIDNIPSGTYNIVINANGNVVSQPFTVVK